jgi:radical SAM protein with 4Fe4S-binding SPASM domain
VSTVLKCPLLAGTATDHADIRRLAERLGAGVVFDPAIFTATAGASGPTRCRGEDEALVDFFADPASRRAAPLRPPREADALPCGMARTFVVVGPSGEIHPCVAMPLSAGNVRATPLDEVWTSSPLMNRLRGRTFGALPACGDCPRSGYCNRCSALALLEDGDLDGPSSRACHVAELRERAWGVPAPAGAPAPARRSLRVLQ